MNVLIFGTGFAGQGHAEAFRAVGVDVVGIVGRTPDVVREVARAHDAKRSSVLLKIVRGAQSRYVALGLA